jgi:hypothetical protein
MVLKTSVQISWDYHFKLFFPSHIQDCKNFRSMWNDYCNCKSNLFRVINKRVFSILVLCINTVSETMFCSKKMKSCIMNNVIYHCSYIADMFSPIKRFRWLALYTKHHSTFLCPKTKEPAQFHYWFCRMVPWVIINQTYWGKKCSTCIIITIICSCDY